MARAFCREEFAAAAGMETRNLNGSIVCVDAEGAAVPAAEPQ